MTEPECILFDEPLSALDAQLRAEMRVELRELVTRLGLTAVFVTHDQSEAISMSDRIAVFSAGRLEQYDAPEAVYSHPATSFAAHFVGLSNWIDSRHFFRPEKASLSPAPGARIFTAGVVSSQYLGAGYEVHLLCGGERWTILSPVRAAPGASLTVSVRPEDISHESQNETFRTSRRGRLPRPVSFRLRRRGKIRRSGRSEGERQGDGVHAVAGGPRQ